MQVNKLLIITQKVDKNDPILGFFHKWIEEFSKYFKLVTVICLEKGSYDLPNNVQVFSLGKESGNTRIMYIINFYKYILKERKNYDAVFIHMNPIYVILGGLLWKILNKKISLWYTHKNVDIKLKIAEKLADNIFTASEHSFRLKSSKVKVLGHGIDLERFKLKPKLKTSNKTDILRVITVGRISPIKDYETLISATEILVKKNIPVNVSIIGGASTKKQGKYLDFLHSLVKDKKLTKHISFLGPVNNKDIPNYLFNADLFVNMSHTGSLDKVSLEAAAVGLPIMTCNEAILHVFHGATGIYGFNKKDYLDLANKMLNFYKEGKHNDVYQYDEIIKQHDIKILIPKIVKNL